MSGMLITGANRGLGLGMIKAALDLPKESIPSIIIAACRRPEEARDLKRFSAQNKDKCTIHIVKLEARDFDSYPDFAQNVGNILVNNTLNLLINNAGVGSKFHRIGMVKSEELVNSYIVNTVAPIMLTKMMLPFLKAGAEKSKDVGVKARIVNLSSILGSIALNEDGGHYSYRGSKAALNAATASLKIDLKGTGICAIALHPGWVQTEMGGPKAPLQVPDACKRIMGTIMNLKEEHNGGFWDLDGKKLPW